MTLETAAASELERSKGEDSGPPEVWDTGEKMQATPPPPPSKLVWKSGTAFLSLPQKNKRRKMKVRSYRKTQMGMFFLMKGPRKGMETSISNGGRNCSWAGDHAPLPVASMTETVCTGFSCPDSCTNFLFDFLWPQGQSANREGGRGWIKYWTNVFSGNREVMGHVPGAKKKRGGFTQSWKQQFWKCPNSGLYFLGKIIS